MTVHNGYLVLILTWNSPGLAIQLFTGCPRMHFHTPFIYLFTIKVGHFYNHHWQGLQFQAMNIPLLGVKVKLLFTYLHKIVKLIIWLY